MRLTRITSLFASLLILGLASVASAGQLVISEVVDGSRTGGQPKFVELTNTGGQTIDDLSVYSIGNANNGATTIGGGVSLQLPSVPLAAGASFVIAYEADPFPQFVDTYGFGPDFTTGGGFINGNDVILLFLGSATSAEYPWTNCVDSFGAIGVDGVGQAWEYTDGWARRKAEYSQPLGLNFDSNAFNYSGPNALDGVDDADAKAKLLAQTNPGSHSFDGKGVPGAPVWVVALLGVMLAGLGSFAFLRTRAAQSA